VINSRKISDLALSLQPICRAFRQRCKAASVPVAIISTYRDDEYQEYLYSQGRTRPGSIVTNAHGGQSPHNKRFAFDFCPVINGKCAWGRNDLFQICGEIAESLGLEWAGRWTGSLKESGHCQLKQ